MKFVIEIECGNEAFAEAPGEELARIIEVAAIRVREGTHWGKLRDINGNQVGRFDIVSSSAST